VYWTDFASNGEPQSWNIRSTVFEPDQLFGFGAWIRDFVVRNSCMEFELKHGMEHEMVEWRPGMNFLRIFWIFGFVGLRKKICKRIHSFVINTKLENIWHYKQTFRHSTNFSKHELQEFSEWTWATGIFAVSFTWSKNLRWNLIGIALQNSNGYGLDFDWNSHEIWLRFWLDFAWDHLWFRNEQSWPGNLEMVFWNLNGTLERISKTLERNISLHMEKFWMVEWRPGMSLFCRFFENFWICWFEKENL